MEMKPILISAGIAICLALGGIIYVMSPRVAVTELSESKYLGKTFNNPMYWAAVVGRKPSNFPEEAALDRLADRQIIDIGSVIHYREEDFIAGSRNFEFIPQNQDWLIERVFHVEGNKHGFWIDSRPNYDKILMKNKANGQSYLVLDFHVDMALENKGTYKQFEDYGKFANILDAQKSQEKLLIMVDIGTYKDAAGDEKLPEAAVQRTAEVERLENLVIGKLPSDVARSIREKNPSWPSLVFELDRNDFLKLYSYKYNFGVYTKFTPLFKS